MLGRMRIDAESEAIFSMWEALTASGGQVWALTPFQVREVTGGHQGNQE